MRFILYSLLAFSPCALAADLAPPSNEKPAPSLDAQIQSLKQLRAKESFLAKEAQRDADRYLSKDWLLYRRAIMRQEYLEKRIKEIDQHIADLEKKKGSSCKS
jgi:hypothetical protein